MKRCPQCGREYDSSMMFCLDDGAELLYGPAISEPSATSGDRFEEPQTAILHETAHPGNAATRSKIHTTEEEPRTSFPSQSIARDIAAKPSRPKLLAAGAILAVLLGGFLAYRYFFIPGADQIDSIAVLPFQNTSGGSDTEYLSDGLAESLIYRLSQIPELKVSPRSSVFRYKGKDTDAEQIGSELDVDAVMTGRLVQRGDNLTISVDLVDVRNRKTLWGEQFERKTSELLATQRDIVSAIAEKLQLKLSTKGITKQYTNNNEAYQLYLQGRYFWNKRSADNLKKATELLKSAIEKDPTFALAHAGLADCYAVSYYYVGERPRDSVALVKLYAGKAIELDPTLAEPHTSMGFAYFIDWDFASAEKQFLRAIELNPNYPTAHHWYSRFLRAMGQIDKGWKEIHRAQELEPLSLIFMNNIAEMHIDRAELNEAAALSQRIIDLDPSFWGGHQTLGITLIKQDRLPEALAEAEKSVETSNRMNAPLALLGHGYALQGRRTEAEAIIQELNKRMQNKGADPRDTAIIYTGLGDHDKAFELLQQGFEEHSVFMPYLNLEPLFEPLRGDPRWRDLKRRIGLPD